MNETNEKNKKRERNERQAVHIIVHGRVQGVGFRHFTKTNGQRLGLAGWVRNLSDGTVEIWAEGRRETLEKFIQKVQEGPSYANVSNLEIDWREPKNETATFRIRF